MKVLTTYICFNLYFFIVDVDVLTTFLYLLIDYPFLICTFSDIIHLIYCKTQYIFECGGLG